MKVSARRVLLHRSHHMPHWMRLSRYAIGSLICFGISELVFILLFGVGHLGARTSAVLGFIAGTIPGYVLNRKWTWGRHGRSDFWREIAPYWATAIVSALLVGMGTGLVNAAFIHQSRDVRVFINAFAYMVTNGVIFFGKYVLFHKILFRPRDTAANGQTVEAVSGRRTPQVQPTR